MKPYSQKDKRWANLKIGKSKLTMKFDGCFVTSLASIEGRTPAIVLDILNRGAAFNAQGLLLSDVAAKLLGLNYTGKYKDDPKSECICETDHFKPLYNQHFYVQDGKGNIMDPLDGKIKPNCYRAISYRRFSVKNAATKVVVASNKVVDKSSRSIWRQILDWIYSVSRKSA